MMARIDRFTSWLYTRKIWGPRCPDTDMDCHTCSAWVTHDNLFGGNK